MKPMRWILLASFTLYSALAYCQQSVSPLPLIKNGNMEQKNGQGWFFGYSGQQNTNANGYNLEQTILASASGEFSMRINCKALKNDSLFCNLNQSFSAVGIPAGAKIILKAKLKTVNMQGKGVALFLRGEKVVDGKSSPVFFITTEGQILINGTREFEEYSLVLDPYPGNADKITVLIVYLPATVGAVYIDDVSVTVN